MKNNIQIQMRELMNLQESFHNEFQNTDHFTRIISLDAQAYNDFVASFKYLKKQFYKNLKLIKNEQYENMNKNDELELISDYNGMINDIEKQFIDIIYDAAYTALNNRGDYDKSKHDDQIYEFSKQKAEKIMADYYSGEDYLSYKNDFITVKNIIPLFINKRVL